MVQVTVDRWGDTLALRLPGEIVQAARLRDGERLEIEAHDGDILIRRQAPGAALNELFRGRSPAEWRADYAGAFDWGGDVGREVVPE